MRWSTTLYECLCWTIRGHNAVITGIPHDTDNFHFPNVQCMLSVQVVVFQIIYLHLNVVHKNRRSLQLPLENVSQVLVP